MIVDALGGCDKVYDQDMAFGCEQNAVELDGSIDNTVLMQELQDQADLGCVKPKMCVNITKNSGK